MVKSADAFRTISEVAELLETPTHVLRFWETRFVQIRPVKRGGGRRYYRPADVALLGGIKQLLHTDGFSIRDVQRILKENGVSHVMSFADTSKLFSDPQTAMEMEPEPFNGFTVASRLRTHFDGVFATGYRIRLVAIRARLLLLRQQLKADPNKHL